MLRRWALEAGFGALALCPADGFEAALLRVQSQAELPERRQLRFFPQRELPWARSLAVLLWPYAPAALPGEGEAFVDSYYRASNAAYHAARALEARLKDAGVCAQANVPYPAREAAVRAGLGVIGQNGLLISPQFGTRTVIILIATELPAPVSDRKEEPGSCLRCGRCAHACPGGAIDNQGMSHPERCLRNFMLEGTVIPEPMRARMGARLLGCDICQRVCPMQPAMEQEPCSIALNSLMTGDEAQFAQTARELAQLIGKNVARPQRLRAQAALLSANAHRTQDVPVLRTWAQSPFEAVRVHASWALARLEQPENAKNRASGCPGVDPEGKRD